MLARAYNKDGLLLQMSESMKPLDTLMLAKSRPDSPNGPPGQSPDHGPNLFGQRWGAQILTARSQIGTLSGRVWLIANITSDYTLLEKDMGLTKDELEKSGVYYHGFPEFKLATSNTEFLLTDRYKFELLYRAPIVALESSSFGIFGEIDKWAHLSPQRVKQINNYHHWATIELFGAIGEQITFFTCKLGQFLSFRANFTF